MEQLFEFVTNHYLLVPAFLVVTYLLVQETIENFTRKYQSTSPMLAVNLMNREDSVIIDVRDPNEFARSHIADARNIPLAKLDERISELEDFRNQPLLVTCQAGTRSTAACKKLAKQGFSQVHDLRGGIQAWQESNLPLTKGRK